MAFDMINLSYFIVKNYEEDLDLLKKVTFERKAYGRKELYTPSKSYKF